MLSCWSLEPANRSTFGVLCEELSKILESGNSNYNYLDVEQPIDKNTSAGV